MIVRRSPGCAKKCFARGAVLRRQWLDRAAMVALTALLALGTLVHIASAQITARDLIGKYVDVGPKHSDVKQAIEKFQSGNTKEALELLKAAYKKNLDLPPGQVLFAQLCFAAGLNDNGRAALEQAAAEYPNDPDAFIAFAELALRDRRITDAESLLNRSVALTKAYSVNPKRKAELQKRTYSGLAAVAESREKWDQALNFLNGWLGLEKDSSSLYQRLARAQFQSKKYNEAFEALAQADKIDGKQNGVLRPEVAMGRLYEQSGDHKNAVKFMADALKGGANELQTRLAVGEWALDTDQPDLAKQQAEAALKLDANNLDAKVLRGLVARVQGDLPTAKKYFEEAHLMSPSNFVCTNQLALTLVEMKDEGDKKRALEYAEANRRIYPNVADAFSTLGWVQHRRGNSSTAMQVLNEVAKAGGLSADGAYYVAKIFNDAGQPEKAAPFLQQALQGKISFVYRKDAETLLAQLSRAPRARAGDDALPQLP